MVYEMVEVIKEVLTLIVFPIESDFLIVWRGPATFKSPPSSSSIRERTDHEDAARLIVLHVKLLMPRFTDRQGAAEA